MGSYRCVICGRVRIPFLVLGAGCICRQCERRVLASSPKEPEYLVQARVIGSCFSREFQRLIRGESL